MSLKGVATVLDARTLGPADADRVVRWQGANRDGFVWVGNTHTGQDPTLPTWTDASRLSAQWAWRSASLRMGVPLQTLWQWRPDVISPATSRVEPWARDPAACRRSSVDYRDALIPWTAARWGWGLAGYIDGPWWAALPADRAIYALEDPGARTLSIVGVLADMGVAHADLVASALAWREFVGCSGLLIDVKPYERADGRVATPADPINGTIQPSSYLRGEWEAQISDMLLEIGGAMTVVTLTRSPTPPLWQIIGDASASHAVLGEANLRPATEAV